MPPRPISTAYVAAAAQLRSNPRQQEVYDSSGNCVVLAGPGSGKTNTLVLKLARMLAEDVPAPRGVACITFSQEAARELTKRLSALGLRESSRLFIGTIHSFCLLHLIIPFAKLANLGLPDPIKVAPVDVADKLFREHADRLFGVNSGFRKHEIDLHRRALLDRDSAAWRQGGSTSVLADAYEEALKANGFLDFEDLVHYGQRLVVENDWVLQAIRARFPVLAVDEYQDLGVGLHRIVERLVFEGGIRLLAVGDVDQSVYGFNGARSDLLELLAARREVKQVRLAVNYRNAQSIIDIAERALGQPRGYVASDRGREARIEAIKCEDGMAHQASFAVNDLIPKILASKPGRNLGDIAILYRAAPIGNALAEAATAAGHGFIRVDNAAPYRKTPVTSWIEDCASWSSGGWQSAKPALRDLLGRWVALHRSRLTAGEERSTKGALTKFLWQNRETASAAVYLRELRARLLDPLLKRQPELRDQAAAVVSMTRALKDDGTLAGATTLRLGGRGGAPDQLNLLTLHSAKGMEYQAVIMVGLDQGAFPWRNEQPDVLAESRRLFYVGLTRAKDEVFLLYSGFNEVNGRRYFNGPSIFLDGLLH